MWQDKKKQQKKRAQHCIDVELYVMYGLVWYIKPNVHINESLSILLGLFRCKLIASTVIYICKPLTACFITVDILTNVYIQIKI